MGYVLPLQLQITRQADGSYVAMSRDFPILVVAKDFAGLKWKLREVAGAVEGYLAGLDEADALAFFGERGVAAERVDDDGAGDGNLSIPVLLGA